MGVNNKYYDKGQLLSYNKFLNFIIGHRGVGKTYGFKKWVIKDFIDNGKQFIWIRRYKSELKKINTYFDDIVQEFPEHKMEIKGWTAVIDGKIAGYFIPLSVSSSFKSTSYPNVDKIIYDEFLIDKQTFHYLQDEVIKFLDCIETIFRDRDTQVRGVFCIANNISWANPYFLHFHIPPMGDKRFYTKGEICIENYKNEVFIENKLKTRFGKLISETSKEYMEYAIENKSLLDNDTFIGKKPPYAQFRCAIDYNGFTIGFYLDSKNGYLYAENSYDPYTYAHFSLTRDDHNINTYLVKRPNAYIQDLIFCFQNGLLFFENVQVKSLCYEVFSFFIR